MAIRYWLELLVVLVVIAAAHRRLGHNLDHLPSGAILSGLPAPLGFEGGLIVTDPLIKTG